MKLSTFGQRFSGESGIVQLMDDLGKALAGDEPKIMLGGGNPAAIPAMQGIYRQRMIDILTNEGEFEATLGNYAPPAGDVAFCRALASLLRQSYGWDIGPENIALTNGSQTSFFYLFNLLAGTMPDGSHRKILLPLAPEYIGYADVGLSPDLFISYRPEIAYLDDVLFKYHIDLEHVQVTDEIGAICFSRPTNPTGNVLTDAEVNHLSRLARQHDIPLIIDNAYGAPFPSILFSDVTPQWDDHIILCMSLSKLGLPGARTGIVIAQPEIIEAIANLNAIFSLAPGNTGAAMALDMVRNGDIIKLSESVIRPTYRQKAEQTLAWIRQEMPDIPCRVHKPEGAFFVWLWFEDLPIPSAELYQRLKERNVIVVPGHYFFPGLQEPWAHSQQCLRVSYAPDPEVVQAGIRIIAEEARHAYTQPSSISSH